MKKKNVFLMWPNGPDIELPWGYHWDIGTQQVVMNDGSWRGKIIDFYHHQKSADYRPEDRP